MARSRTALLVLLALLAAPARAGAAQDSPFRTPGMPRAPQPAANPDAHQDPSQTSRFDSSFNPAFSFVVDTALDHTSTDGGAEDGFDARLRVLEFSAQAWVDPTAWAYFSAAADEDVVEIEEAAIHYTGLGGTSTLRAGRFFNDFGKQMQTHVHELRTLERPLVLRTYLGDELAGDGLQWDAWAASGDATVVRWSLGAFRSLLGESEDEDLPAAVVAERKDAEDMHLTARLTGFTEVGAAGVLQAGLSLRAAPDYAFTYAPSGDTVEGLENTVFGLDLTYGWNDASGLTRWTLGGELLQIRGDVGADVTDVGGDGDPTNDTLAIVDDDRSGWLAFADYALDARTNVGAQYSAVELLDGAGSRAGELELYYTLQFSEFHRLRFVASSYESDLDDDSLRFAIQYTALVGAHGHGVNW